MFYVMWQLKEKIFGKIVMPKKKLHPCSQCSVVYNCLCYRQRLVLDVVMPLV